ncbi:Rho GTPase-activating protein [Komagataella phaffii CBS 7435]|uniref:GTPase-activating protein for the polarity-establishment protein Cdc42p n=2 Tax=Komagataella phaffii TaxID=460519 RepID=C4QVE7_KOMPG|nr:GTPase-activating protein for the polarity-establishment protein Cdc42p [Komagataella phaffii GS115]AOA60750.1 GQ67_02413T0 [Komagataella phaffii]CAH2445876.1 Rho GTPase-activating protein [Komagataella phaffii CBS 7435]AOA66004.1 GQ68_02834T0 [Komagataella phaffii GS115]CAY67220.1 GTPase-activating protein for the polarity-establishment protein Cdc42p [Komagataella phaffii GS115]CCA36328.1 Rho GTPase-activating protein [Komagataella phaffii CBS 7435]
MQVLDASHRLDIEVESPFQPDFASPSFALNNSEGSHATKPASSPDLELETGQICKKCGLVITEGHAYELGEDRWHVECFSCSKCSKSLGCDSNFLVLGTGALVCSDCSYACTICSKKIYDLAILTGNQAYCSSCFQCRACKNRIEDLRYARTSKGLFCISCHMKLLEKKKRHEQQRKKLMIHTNNSSSSSTKPSADNSNPNSATTADTSVKNKQLPDLPLPASSNYALNPPVKVHPRDSASNVNTILDSLDVETPGDPPQPVPPPFPRLRPNSPPISQFVDYTFNSPVELNSDEERVLFKTSPSTKQFLQSPDVLEHRKAVLIDDVDSDVHESSPEVEPEPKSEPTSDTDVVPKGLNINTTSKIFKNDTELNLEKSTNQKIFALSSEENVSHEKEKLTTKISRSLSMRSISSSKNKLGFNFHRRTSSKDMDTAAISQLNTPKARQRQFSASSQRVPSSVSSHNRTASDLMFLKNSSKTELDHLEAQMKRIQNEVNQLTVQKETLQSEIFDLEKNKQSLLVNIDEIKSRFEGLQTSLNESNTAEQPTDTPLETLVEAPITTIIPRQNSTIDESSLSDNFNSGSLSTSAPTSNSKNKPKGRFWRMGKSNKKDIPNSTSNYSLSNVFKSNPVLIQSKDPMNEKLNTNPDLTERDNFFTSMIKSTSTNILYNMANSKTENHPNHLFNMSLQERATYEGLEVPIIVTKCIEKVEQSGLSSEGIYRLSGGSSSLERVESCFSSLSLEDITNEKFDRLHESLNGDINTVAGVLKRYLSKLPEPLVTFDLYEEFVNIARLDDKITSLRTLVNKLLPTHRKTLYMLCKHLNNVVQHGNVNLMNVNNIAVVFAATLARSRVVNLEKEMSDISARRNVTETLISHYDQIFQQH